MKEGGKLSIGDLKGLLNQSYESKKPKNYLDFEVDKDLSGERVQVYRNKKTGQVVVSHRGTQGIHDIGNDLKYALGMDLSQTKRFKHAEDVQRRAEAKYGKENITTIGHSLGSKIARDVGKNTKEVIQANPAYNIPDSKKKTKENTYTIRTQYDPVSFLQPKKTKNVTTIESTTKNPLKEHGVDSLGRADPDEEIGGASQLQKGMASNMRDYFPEGSDQKRALNSIIHSGEPNPKPSIFSDITNSYDPNVDRIIEGYYEEYLYNWYDANGYLGTANEDGLSKYFERDAYGQFRERLNKKGNVSRPKPPERISSLLGYPKTSDPKQYFELPTRAVLAPPVRTPWLVANE